MPDHDGQGSGTMTVNMTDLVEVSWHLLTHLPCTADLAAHDKLSLGNCASQNHFTANSTKAEPVAEHTWQTRGHTGVGVPLLNQGGGKGDLDVGSSWPLSEEPSFSPKRLAYFSVGFSTREARM